MNKRNRKIHALRAGFVKKLATQLSKVEPYSKTECVDILIASWYKQHLIMPKQAGFEVMRMKDSVLNRIYSLMVRTAGFGSTTIANPYGTFFYEKFSMAVMAFKRDRSSLNLNVRFFDIAYASYSKAFSMIK